jgi:hypothetical protein
VAGDDKSVVVAQQLIDLQATSQESGDAAKIVASIKLAI